MDKYYRKKTEDQRQDQRPAAISVLRVIKDRQKEFEDLVVYEFSSRCNIKLSQILQRPKEPPRPEDQHQPDHQPASKIPVQEKLIEEEKLPDQKRMTTEKKLAVQVQEGMSKKRKPKKRKSKKPHVHVPVEKKAAEPGFVHKNPYDFFLHTDSSD